MNETSGDYERFRALEETQRATFNILEDFNEEKVKLGSLQHATMNLLDDVEEERQKYRDIQSATANVLEDFDEERGKFREVQIATLNLLEDVNVERDKFAETQRALMNMLDDIEVERTKVDQAKTLLESANKELEAFSYSVSHDLQAPLRAISGFAQAVGEDNATQLDSEGHRYLKLVQENAHKMGQLIQDLLSFSRLGRQAIGLVEISMEKLAKEVFEELRSEMPDRTVEFKVGSLPTAMGDPAMIRQVFVNLLANALKFTRLCEKAVIEVGYRQEGAGGVYHVRDNGAGFDVQFVGKLFGVFQRLHTVGEFEGTGVGLALVKRIVTRHGGRVWAEGKVNQGATFYFTLERGVNK